jgi:hypothetical protein
MGTSHSVISRIESGQHPTPRRHSAGSPLRCSAAPGVPERPPYSRGHSGRLIFKAGRPSDTVCLVPEHYEDFDDNRVKHLEMIQGVIARLGGNSFLVKGWAVTVSGAFMGFAITGKEWELAAAGLLPVALFWWLDGYFLRAERLFRGLHEAVRTSDEIAPFFMAATRKDLALTVAALIVIGAIAI